MSDDQLCNKLEALAKSGINPNAQIVLFVLAGALEAGSDYDLAGIVRKFAVEQVRKLKASQN